MGASGDDRTDVLVLGPEVAPTQLLAQQAHAAVGTASTVTPPPEVALAARQRGAELVTPERAMLYDEATRLRAFSGFLAILSAITVAMVIALGGDPTARAMHLGAV